MTYYRVKLAGAEMLAGDHGVPISPEALRNFMDYLPRPESYKEGSVKLYVELQDLKELFGDVKVEVLTDQEFLSVIKKGEK